MTFDDFSPLIVGNWKMNGLQAALGEISALCAKPALGVEMVVCPPATLLASARIRLGDSPIALGGQDCHEKASGPFTGSISAEMLKDAGCLYVIVGHSERRTLLGETDAIVQAKVCAAWRADLTAIVCVGETRQQREAGEAFAVVREQVRRSLPPSLTPERLVIAYEPVFAIGTGLTPTLDDIAQMHAEIRAQLHTMWGEKSTRVRILYGGSVKPSNAGAILNLPNVNGALIGGASLKASEFLEIAASYKHVDA